MTFKIVRISAVLHSLMEAVQSKNCLRENRDSWGSINSLLHSCKALSKHALFFRSVLTFRNTFKWRKRQWAYTCGLLDLNPFNTNNSSSASQGLNQVLITTRVAAVFLTKDWRGKKEISVMVLLVWDSRLPQFKDTITK